jgi:Protein of unknown function (DUF1572)
MAHEFTTSYLTDAIALLRYYKSLGERAIEQTPDEALTTVLDPESNSIAIIVKHLAGNMRSRWMDYLTSDGEKPDRNRDSEFEAPAASRADLTAQWESGWREVFTALATLTDADLSRTVRIRGEAHSVLQAINRNLTHAAYHVGQIVYLAKHFTGSNWKSLTIPRGQSGTFNAKVASGEKSQR